MTARRKHLLGTLFLAGVAALGLLQFFRPAIPERAAVHPIEAPHPVRQILEKDCYSCHSDQRRLAWFDQIQPAYWLVRKDILAGRNHLNFSTLGSKPTAAQRAALYEAVNMIQLGAMPLPRFTQLHPEAKVTPEELATLKTCLAPWASVPQASVAASGAGPAKETKVAPPSQIRPELNGIAFDPDFGHWKLLSITDRGDNNTFRFVLGNPIAVEAAKRGQLSPWPDGTRFAKVAWQQETGADGLVHAGSFVQVELMVKDAQRYRRSDGWGWGRWRGADLKPYGQDAHFVSECTSCHAPMRGNDFVYTEPITRAAVAGNEVVNNAAAALPAGLPYQPLGWTPVTLYVDRGLHTMSALFRNTSAAPGSSAGAFYPEGTILALVTWGEREDPHWFGARIPGDPRLVEFLQIGRGGQEESYRRYAGSTLKEMKTTGDAAAQRVRFLLALKPGYIP